MGIEQPLRWLPNLLSAGRIAMAPLVCLLLWREAWLAALGWLLLAALTDLLDGWLARRQDWLTPLGALLDPLADKVLVISVATTLWWLALLPGWLLGLILLRDAVIMGGALAWRLKTGGLKGEPLLLGKLATLAVLTLLLFLPAGQALESLRGNTLLPVLQALVALLLALSGGAYVQTWWNRWLLYRETR